MLLHLLLFLLWLLLPLFLWLGGSRRGRAQNLSPLHDLHLRTLALGGMELFLGAAQRALYVLADLVALGALLAG